MLLSLGEAASARTASSTEPRLPVVGVDDAGADVELLGGDPQRAGQLLEHLGRRLAQAALDLAEVGVAHSDLVGELSQRELAPRALLLEVVAQRAERADDRLARLAAGLGSRLAAFFELALAGVILSLAMPPLC